MALARFPRQIISVHRAHHAVPLVLIVEAPFGSVYELGAHIVDRFFVHDFDHLWYVSVEALLEAAGYPNS